MKYRQRRTVLMLLYLFVFLGGIVVWHGYDARRWTAAEFDSRAIRERSEPLVREIEGAESRADLDRYLQRREDIVDRKLATRGAAIKTDQRKQIIWAPSESAVESASKPTQRTPLSLIYIHGFSASGLEMQPVVSDVALKLGANLFITRLTAHGLSDGEDFASVRAQDWAVDVDEAMAIGRKIGRRVVIIAMSTGAPLVLDYLRRDYIEDSQFLRPAGEIASLVLLSPNYEPAALGTRLLEGRLGADFARTLLGSHRKFETENEQHAERWTSRYRSEGLAAMMTAVASVRDMDFSKVPVPVLTIYSEKDNVVSTAKIRRRSSEFPEGSQIVDWKPATRHELASATFNSEHITELEDLIANWIEYRK